LRLKSFQPEEEYVYLTYSMKNDEGEESEVLLENYRVLLQRALDWLWERIKVERREVKRGKKVLTKVKITLPREEGSVQDVEGRTGGGQRPSFPLRG
jgi:hypothetical protein